MDRLSRLEYSAIAAIAAASREHESPLKQQLAAASAQARENTGAGFFTKLTVQSMTTPCSGIRFLENNVFADVEGLEHGVGFVLFLDNGFMSLLEGYALANESTTGIEWTTASFSIRHFTA